MIHHAIVSDIDIVKRIADANRSSIGFVLRKTLQDACDNGWLIVAEDNDGDIIGFCNYRHCRNGRTTIYELCVSSTHRGIGTGRDLITYLMDEAKRHGQLYLFLKSVVGLPANGFYEKMGFSHCGIDSGKKRPLNMWRLDVVRTLV